ncbi:SpoIIE family protein phosphatase [Streptomyces albogriseolus]|uniref:SpoIIE family protein phosphatase n=1 Tax=Streptomyces albogriseolus TaxID=1887 RepID=UPI002255A95A|nr:SpoIIE family protein phosphatase [Streptomyces viridodiastaticus]MCX4618022.1 SpoIIE family protein phosphatase [Streptomyces viridodiastaticus]
MGNRNAPGALSRRRFQGPRSVAQARRFVRAVLDGAARELVDTAELLVSELVTNAVLHADTEVEVSAGAEDGTVHVRIRDHRPDRGLVPHDCPPYAGTGQGLALVDRLAFRHGVDTGTEDKTVWFELRSDGPPPQQRGWEAPVPSSCAGRTVTLIDVPRALYAVSQQHRSTLLREMALAMAAGADLGVLPEDLAVAQDISNVISACVAGALRQQPAEAEIGSLPLEMPPDAAVAVRVLWAVLDLAEEAAREERLLTLPSLPRSRVFTQWLLGQIAGQLSGEHPTAWTVVPREPGAGPSEPVPWDTGHVEASRVPMIAADERNLIIAANGPAADMLGWHPDELVGQSLTTLMPEHLRQRHTGAFTSLLLTGQPRILGRSVPLPALHREGRLVPVRLFIQTQETGDGRTVFVAQLTPRASAPVAPPHPWARSRSLPTPQETTGTGLPPSAALGGRRETGRGLAGTSALDRLALVADTGAALSNALDLIEGLQRVGGILTERLADWCAVDLLAENAEVERVCVVHRAPHGELPEYEGPLPRVSESAGGPLARALRGAGPLLLTESPTPSQAASPLDDQYLELLRTIGADSAVVAPLRARREIIGALTVARSGPSRPFTEEDLPLVDDLVRTIALGVDNARLYQETRNIAERLQRSLLPVLPDIGNLQLAARYAASSTTAQVGGDWYDSFVVPNGDTALVIGDVTGHNLDAAIAMSQLRSMLRGIAVDRQEPPETVLRRLDMANHSLYREATATCIYSLLKGSPDGPWELVHSSAGHLPPLLVMPDGRTRYLEDGSGLLLGMDPDMPRPRGRNAIPAHATVLLYTDGLIERRDESLDHAMERLRRRAGALAGEPLHVFCDELLIGLGADSEDDIAVLAARPVN